MFDIGFWELVIIAVVALLVVGPDRLPGLIRETAKWFTKIRRFVINTKREIEREINLEDVQKDLSTRIVELENKVETAPDKKATAHAQDDTPAADKQASA